MNIWLSVFGPTIHGESAAEVVAGERRAGANALLVFISLYHGYRLLQQRYPHHAVYSLETDRVPVRASFIAWGPKPKQVLSAVFTRSRKPMLRFWSV